MGSVSIGINWATNGRPAPKGKGKPDTKTEKQYRGKLDKPIKPLKERR